MEKYFLALKVFKIIPLQKQLDRSLKGSVEKLTYLFGSIYSFKYLFEEGHSLGNWIYQLWCQTLISIIKMLKCISYKCSLETCSSTKKWKEKFYFEMPIIDSIENST